LSATGINQLFDNEYINSIFVHGAGLFLLGLCMAFSWWLTQKN